MGKLRPHDPLAAVRKDPTKVTSFLLNPAALRNQGFDCPPVMEFPRELLACTKLKSLELFRGIDYRGDQTIPDDIDRLKNLEELSLGGLGMTTLPATIGKLKKLRVLSLVYCESLEELPDSIGDLSELEELSLGYTALESLPRTIGKLRKLKTLTLDGITEVPAELFKAEALESLVLPDSVDAIPKGLGHLVNLRSLGISSKAITSAAEELPKLTKLNHLRVTGTTKTLPDSIGELGNLEELQLGYIDLEKLPPLGKLTKMRELGVGGNKLTTLVDVVLSLPKLETLSFSGNPLARGEKKRIDALMKLPPGKRKSVGTGAKAQPPAQKKAPPKIERLGNVTSINASLAMLVADARVAAKFQGVDNGEDENSANSDWDRLREALDDDDCAKLDLGGARALALSLNMGSGQVKVWAVGDRLVLFEGFFEDDEDSLDKDDREIFHEYIAGPPADDAQKIGDIAIESGLLVLMPSTDACPDVAAYEKKKPKSRATKCGDEKCGLLIAMDASRYAILIEDEVESSWGSGRRCHFVPK
jgi:hypothetical protein